MPSTQIVVGQLLEPSYSKISGGKEREFYWKLLLKHYGKRSNTSIFPSNNPCSISKNDFKHFKGEDYKIALKSDGIRYTLLLTLRPDSITPSPVAVMVDRAKNMFEVEVLAPEEHFLNTTMLEGELVWQQPEERCLLFMVFDCLVDRGKNHLRTPFHKRLEIATKLTRWSEELMNEIDMEQRTMETECLVMCHYNPKIIMRPKQFVERKHAERLWNERGDFEHRVDGIILNANDSPYICGKAHESVFKWKENSSIDLKGTLEDLHHLSGPLPKTICDKNVVVKSSRIECKPDSVTEFHVEVTNTDVVLFPTRSRGDKDSPNSMVVIEATVVNVIEGITPQELGSSVSFELL